MATISLPVPISAGVGAAVNVGTLTANRVVNANGPFSGPIIIEVSDDNATWVQAIPFEQSGTERLLDNSRWMRVRRELTTTGTVLVSVTNYQVEMTFATAALDSFGRQRVSSADTLFDSKLLTNNQPLIFDDQQVSGAGTTSTYNTNQSSVTLAVAATTAGKRVRQSYIRNQYQPGKSQLVFMTGIIGAAQSGITREIGIHDDQNGLLFQMTGNGMGLVIRTFTSGAPVELRIDQADWNIDKMDGTGPSGINLDFTTTQIFGVDYEWLGVGAIRWFFVNGDNLYYCHHRNNANVLSMVYMSNPNLPVRYSIENDGTGDASTLLCICNSVISEGGRNSVGPTRSADRGTTPLVVNATGTVFSLLAMRLNQTIARADALGLTVFNNTNDPFLWRLIRNPTLATGAYTWVAEPNSPIDIARPANTLTYVAGTGVEINAGYAVANEAVQVRTGDFRLGASIAGVSDIVALAIVRVSGGGSEDLYGTLTWQESV